MRWIDRLAAHALSTGRTAPQFRLAAQHNANGTWGWIILAAIVWYFAGGTWALVPIALAVYTAYKSVCASLIAGKLESIVTNGGPTISE